MQKRECGTIAEIAMVKGKTVRGRWRKKKKRVENNLIWLVSMRQAFYKNVRIVSSYTFIPSREKEFEIIISFY